MRNRRPDGYYDNFEVLSKDILKLKNEIGRFPNKEEILGHLKIGYWYLKKHGGMYEIKRKLNVNDERNKFIDNNGFYNNSSYEMIVANFLIENKVPYLREQLIDKNFNYRSDFTIFDENDHVTHIEVWGYLKSNKTKISIEYNVIRDIKENLYRDKGIEYLSVEPTIFYKKNYNKMQQNLIDVFSSILRNSNLKLVQQDVLIPSYEYSDEEILEIALSYSDDKDYLPEVKVFRENHMGLYNQILKRYQNYNNFADKFNKKLTKKSNGYWTEQRIFQKFDYMINKYGKILSKIQVFKEKYNDDTILDYSKICASFGNQYRGIIDLKLDYYTEKVNDRNYVIPDSDLVWIKRAVINLSRRGNIPYTLEQQERAKLIIEKYNAKSLTPTM